MSAKPVASERSHAQLNAIASNIGGTTEQLRRQLAKLDAGAPGPRSWPACRHRAQFAHHAAPPCTAHSVSGYQPPRTHPTRANLHPARPPGARPPPLTHQCRCAHPPTTTRHPPVPPFHPQISAPRGRPAHPQPHPSSSSRPPAALPPCLARPRAQGGRQGAQGVPGLPHQAGAAEGRPGGAHPAQQGVDSERAAPGGAGYGACVEPRAGGRGGKPPPAAGACGERTPTRGARGGHASPRRRRRARSSALGLVCRAPQTAVGPLLAPALGRPTSSATA